jgi:hypothetical protein
MDRIDLGRVRHGRDKGVRHTFLVASDAADPDIIALGCADDLKLWHGSILSMVFSIETTREECQIDRANYFFEQISTTCEMSLRGAPARRSNLDRSSAQWPEIASLRSQ